MSSISLPALSIRPPQPAQDPLENYARLQQLRNQAQLQPLQVQAAQQQVQAGQLENQQRQLQMQDAQTLRQISPDFVKRDADGKVTGYDYQGFFNKAASSGVSPNTLLPLQKSVSEAVLSQLNVSKEQRAAQQAINDQAYQHLEGLKGVTDPAQRQQMWTAATQWAQQNAPTAAQALPQQAPDDKGLAMIEAQLGMHAQLLADATKAAETFKNTQQGQEASANATLANSKNAFYQQTGMPPGVSPEEQGLAAYLKANPGKTAQDFLKWKAQNSPSMILQGLSQGSANSPGMQAPGGGTDWGKVAQKYGMTAPAFDQTAEKYFSTGNLPQIGRSPNAIAMNRDLMNRAAELHPGASLAENSAEFKANSDSLKTLQSNFDQVSSFEGTANKNIEMLKNLASKVPDLGSKFLNVPVRMISGNMIGTENMAAFKTALAPVQAESAKILNSANLSGQLSDSSRHELQGIVDGNLPYPALVASLSTLQQDFKNRHDSMSQQIGDIQTRLKGASPGSSTPAPTGKLAPGAIITQNGHKYKVTAVDANGKPTSADPL